MVYLDDTVQMEPQRVQWFQGTSHQDPNWDENTKAHHHQNAMYLCISTSLHVYDRNVLAHCTFTDTKLPAHHTSADGKVPALFTSS